MGEVVKRQLLVISVLAAIALAVAEGEPTPSKGSEPAPVVSCASGPAVPDALANRGLRADCALLLRLGDLLEGQAPVLNWSAELPMTSWTGVTIGGGRVTKLSLASSGLAGQVSGLVGELGALTELHLNDNALGGILPSKLWQLAQLTHVYVDGNAFTGCVPPSLRMVSNNDASTLGLPDCAAATDVEYDYWERPLGPGTYQYGQLIFDVPAGTTVMLAGGFIGHTDDHQEVLGLVLQVVGGESKLCLELRMAVECGRTISATADGAVVTTFDLISASLWRGRQPPQPHLDVISDSSADALLLEWTIDRPFRGVSKWQYRQRETQGDEEQPQGWSAWTDVPGSDAATRAYRVAGLKEGQEY